MRTFVESCLPTTAGSDTAKVVLIGADCPQLTAGAIQLAFNLLNQHDVVLGPSSDGGYYLLGIRNHCPPALFTDVPWSTSDVLKITVERLQHQSLRFTMLDEQTDVDDEASLRHLLAGARQPKTSLDPTLKLRLQQIEQQLSLAGHAFP